jgi:hypothetical protein
MASYNEIVKQAQQLTTEQQLRLLEELAAILRHQVATNAKAKPPTSIVDIFSELRLICAEENYTLETPSRLDRSNPFAQLTDLSGYSEFRYSL